MVIQSDPPKVFRKNVNSNSSILYVFFQEILNWIQYFRLFIGRLLTNGSKLTFAFMMVCFFIGGFTVEASRDYDYLSRLNYGVWFTPVRTVRMVTDIWMQVFDVPLPEVPILHNDIRYAANFTPNCTGNMPVRRRMRCRDDRAVYYAVHDLYTNMTRQVIKMLEHLHDLLPTENNIATAGISDRKSVV